MSQEYSVSSANTRSETQLAVNRAIDAYRYPNGARLRKPINWRSVAKQIEIDSGIRINAGFLNAVYRGKEKASDKVLQALRVKPDVIAELVPVCPQCGRVHVVGWCTEAEGEPVRPAPPRAKRVMSDADRAKLKTTRARNKALRLFGEIVHSGYSIIQSCSYTMLSADVISPTTGKSVYIETQRTDSPVLDALSFAQAIVDKIKTT